MIEWLLDGSAWVSFCFTDGTVQSFLTSLNKDVLIEYGIIPVKDFLLDLEQLRLIKWREDIQDIQITREKPVYQDEVNRFGSSFI